MVLIYKDDVKNRFIFILYLLYFLIKDKVCWKYIEFIDEVLNVWINIEVYLNIVVFFFFLILLLYVFYFD